MEDLNFAYGVVRDHSMVWLDDTFKAKLESNYLRAIPLAEGNQNIQAIATLIEGIWADSLYCLLDDGRKIDPYGIHSLTTDRAVSVNFTERGFAVVSVPHFDADKIEEFKGLFQLRNLLFQKPLKIDLRGNRGNNSGPMLDLLAWLFGEDWTCSLHQKRFFRADYQWRVSLENLKYLESIDADSLDLKRHISEVHEKMVTTQDEFVSTRLPECDVATDFTPRRAYEGKVTLIVNDTLKGSALTMVELLDGQSGIKMEGEVSQRLKPYSDPITAKLSIGLFAAPRKKSVLSA